MLAFYFVGHSLRVAVIRTPLFRTVRFSAGLAFDVMLSILCFMGTSIGLSLVFQLTGNNVMLVLGSVMLGSSALCIVRPRGAKNQTMMNGSRIAAVLVVSIGLFVAAVFREAFVWPSMPGWDLYVHLAASNWIVAHNGVTSLFPAGTGSAPPYPYAFYVMVASMSGIVGSNPYTIFWLGPYFSIPAYGLVVYALASLLTQSRVQGVIAALLAVSISGGDALLGPQYFFPSTAFILLFLLCLTAVVGSPLRGVSQAVFASVSLVGCYLLYYYPLFLTLPALALALLFRGSPAQTSNQRRMTPFVIALVTCVAFTYFGSVMLGGGSFPLSERIAILNESYPDFLWLLISLGGTIMIYQFIARGPKQLASMGLVAYTATLLGIYLLPIPSSDRSELVLRPIAAIVASYAIFTVIRPFSPGQTVEDRRVGKASRTFVKVLVVVFLVLSSVLLIQPYFAYGKAVPSYSNISNDEYQASIWLSRNTPSYGYLLSDPSTGMVLRGLTLINSSTAFIDRGHTPSPADNYTLTRLIYDFFVSQNITQAKAYLSELPKTPNFVVISSRTASWASWGGINSTFVAPTRDKPNSFGGFQKFATPLFSLIATWNTVRIYTIVGVEVVPASVSVLSAGNLGQWYLDGSYGNHDVSFNSGMMQITVQSNASSNAWMGPSLNLPGSIDGALLQMNYTSSPMAYALEIILWGANGSQTISTLSQTPGLHEKTIPLWEIGNGNITRVSIVEWTKDLQIHMVDVDSLVLSGYSAQRI